MKSILFAIILGAQFTHAVERASLIQEKLKDISLCQNFVQADQQNIYLGYGYYSNTPGGKHTAQPTNLKVISLGSAPELSLKLTDTAIDLAVTNDRLYVLTYTGIEEWDKQSLQFIRKYPTYLKSGEMEFEEHPNQMALSGDKLIIAHGRLGFSVFDLNSKAIVYQQDLFQDRLPLESKVTGVAIVGDQAYFAVDSFSMVDENAPEKPFQGIVAIDAKTFKVQHQLEGLDDGSDAVFGYDDKLIVSLYGIPLLKFDTNKLKGSRLPSPISRVSHFPETGRLLGKPQLDGDYIYTCFQKMPLEDGAPITRTPRVWKRSDLRLN